MTAEHLPNPFASTPLSTPPDIGWPEPRETISPQGTPHHTQGEVAALREQNQRQAAKFDNYRKRLSREKSEAVQFANERLIKDLLPSIDNLSLALHHSDSTDKEQLALGVKMTLDMLMNALRKHGLVGFDSLNKPFDPRHHQALNQIDDPSVPSNTILKEAQRGYMLHERLLRPALVSVSIGGTVKTTNPAEGTHDTEVSVFPDAQSTGASSTSPNISSEGTPRPDAPMPVSSTSVDGMTSVENDGAPSLEADGSAFEEVDLADLDDALEAFLSDEPV